MQRAAAIALLGVCVLALLGLARLRGDVDEELQGARTMAELAERLSTLGQLSDAQAVRTLQDWQRAADVRHLRVRVVDSAGQVVLMTEPDPAMSAFMRWMVRAGDWLFTPGPPFTIGWRLPRSSGTEWSVSLTASPESERIEGLGSLLEGVALLGLVSVGMLAVMTWNTRRAFRPLDRLLDAIGGLDAADRSPEGTRVRQLPLMPIAELETIAVALRQLDESLFTSQQAQRHLVRQVISLQEDERRRLARELHDEFGQRLTALRANAAWLTRKVAQIPDVLPVVQDMASQCELIQRDIRTMLTRLRPLAGDVEGESLAALAELLDAMVGDWHRTRVGQTAFSLELSLARPDGSPGGWLSDGRHWCLDGEAALALYRISQEGLTNVARHAQARHARLVLSIGLPTLPGGDACIDWSIEDDGLGLAEVEAAFRRGNGLAGLKERVWSLGAELELAAGSDTAGPRGLRLSARFRMPIHRVASIP